MSGPEDYNLPGARVGTITKSLPQTIRPRNNDLRSEGERTPLLAKPKSWTVEGLCWDRETHLPIAAYDKDNLSDAEASMLCAGCPVRDLCLADALAFEGEVGPRTRFGVRGGMTGPQRAKLAQAPREMESA